MTDLPEQPARQPEDGQVAVSLTTDGKVCIHATTNGVDHVIICSPYNAWRLFGMMAIILELPLSKAVAKAIQMGSNLKATLR